MSKSIREPATLTEREQICLEHLRQAEERQISFTQYCREQDLKFSQWYWVKRALVRKGVISGRDKSDGDKRSGFAPVHVAPSAATACRISHPSGWVIECESLPQTQWLTGLLSGAIA